MYWYSILFLAIDFYFIYIELFRSIKCVVLTKHFCNVVIFRDLIEKFYIIWGPNCKFLNYKDLTEN